MADLHTNSKPSINERRPRVIDEVARGVRGATACTGILCTVNCRDLTRNFEGTWSAVWIGIDGPEINVAALKQYVVPPEQQNGILKEPSAFVRYTTFLLYKWGFKSANARLRARAKAK